MTGHEENRHRQALAEAAEHELANRNQPRSVTTEDADAATALTRHDQEHGMYEEDQ